MSGFVFILVLFGVINIYKSCKIIETQANNNLIYQVKEIADRENDYFREAENETERAKKMIELTADVAKLDKVAPVAYKYSEHQVPYVENYLKTIVSPLLFYSTKNVEGLVSIFFDFDHKYLVNRNILGVWYTRNNLESEFKLTRNGPITDMSDESSHELEWYYKPQNQRKSVWSSPYVDNDLKIDMITYSTPVYAGKRFLGVVGVDISMEGLKNLVQKFNLYETGKIYLIGSDNKIENKVENKIIYAKDYKSLTSTKVIDRNLYEFLAKYLKVKHENSQTQNVCLLTSSNGANEFAVTELDNGFVLVVEVPFEQLYSKTHKLVAFMSYFLILVVVLSLFIAIKSYARIRNINNKLVHKEKLISMGTMAAEVAHEINTPLGYLNCNIDTLKDFLGNLKEFMSACEAEFEKVLSNEVGVVEHIKIVKKLRRDSKLDYILESIDDLIDESKYGIRKVSAIVFNLKNFSKDDSKHIKTEEDVGAIIDESLKILNSKIASDVKIVTHFEVMPYLLCNKIQILQVLVNITDNAYNAVKGKNIADKTIIISCYQKGKNAYIEIEDNGEGIEKSTSNKIFEAFFTTKIGNGGTGLGLSVAYHIIANKHNGEILVESSKGHGSKFIIRIPYQKNIKNIKNIK